MALTMTRTRTQTTLTKLAEMVANVHGELAFLEWLLARADVDAPGRATASNGLTPAGCLQLRARKLKLVADRDALHATVRQFDPSIDPERIGALEGWRLRFGRRGLGVKTLVTRYLTGLAHHTNCQSSTPGSGETTGCFSFRRSYGSNVGAGCI